MGLMPDALYPYNIPAGEWQAAATELDNTENGAAWTQLIARFPELARAGRLVPIVVNPADAGHPPAGSLPGVMRVSTDAADIERGALTPAQGAQVVEATPNAPVLVYFSIGDLGAVEQALGRPWVSPGHWPAPGPYKWDADWTGRDHCNPDSLLTQFSSPTVPSLPGQLFDLSRVSPAAPTFPLVPISPSPTPPKGPPVIAVNKPPVGPPVFVPGMGPGDYWVCCADGGVITFGHAPFYGSLGDVALAAPIVGMAATPTGHGYTLQGADGGIFTFGDAIDSGRVVVG